jgi:phosphoglycolate phosphatase-like HAD superfamily hydrolase
MNKDNGVVVMGYDWDGVLHNSLDNALSALNATLVKYDKRPISSEQLGNLFTSDFPKFLTNLKIPENEHGQFLATYRVNYKGLKDSPLIPGSLEILALTVEKFGADNNFIITNETESRVQNYLQNLNLSYALPQVIHCSGTKEMMLQQTGITHYVGDCVSDGEACLWAKTKPVFIGFAHKNGFNTPQRLYQFQNMNPDHPIHIVQSLDEIRHVLENHKA